MKEREELKEPIYYRSHLFNMAKLIGIDPNNYISQIRREYPYLIIINDLSSDESIF